MFSRILSIVICLFAIVWIVDTFAQISPGTWNPQKTPTNIKVPFKAVSMADDLHGIAVGGDKILKTLDGGLNWTEEAFLYPFNTVKGKFTGVSMILSTNYRAVAVTDGGQIWYNMSVFGTGGDNVWGYLETPGSPLKSVSITEDGSGYIKGFAVGSSGDIWYTPVDITGPWIKPPSSPPQNFNSVAIINNSGVINGIVVGEYGFIFITIDGGATWSAPITNPALSKVNLRGVSLASNGTNTNAIAVGNVGKLYVSNDLGETWTENTSISGGTPPPDLFSVTQFWDGMYFVGLTVGQSSNTYNNNDAANSTSTWTSYTVYPGINLKGVSLGSDINGIAVGDNGNISITSDAGSNWSDPIPNPGFAQITLNGINFVNKQDGWAVGDVQTIIHTGDGGVSWNIQPVPEGVMGTLNDVAFADMNNGIAVGFDGTNAITLYTDDGGNEWVLGNNGEASADLKAAVSLGELSYVAVGSAGKVFRTTDGGQNWNTASTFFSGTENFNDVDAANNVAVAVGTNGTGAILYVSTDGGDTWTLTDLSNLTSPTLGITLTAVALFFDGSYVHGWAADNAGNIIYSADVTSTTPNWYYRTPFPGFTAPAIIKGMDFIDLYRGVAVGQSAENQPLIFRTQDGAQNVWVGDADSDPDANPLNDVSLKTGSLWGWAAGKNGVILNYPTIIVYSEPPTEFTRSFNWESGVNKINVPLDVDVTTHLDDGNVISFDITMNVNPPEDLFFYDINFDWSGTGANNFIFAFNKETGVIAASGTNPLSGWGRIGDFQFIPTFRSPGSADLSFTSMMFNEGVPGTILTTESITLNVTNIQTGDANNDNRITFEDAVAVLRHRVGLIQIPYPNAEYAEVSGAMGLTAYDAGLILQVNAYIEDLFPKEKRVLGLLKGVKPVRNADAQIVLSPISDAPNELTLIISAKGMQKVLSMDMVLTYPSEQFEYRDFTILAGNLSAEANVDNGVLKFAMAGTQPLDNDARLVALRFRAANGVSAENFKVSQFLLNEDAVTNISFGEAVDESAAVPKEFALVQNYPNPFNPDTHIKYALAEQVQVKLEIFNIVGQKIRTLINARQPAGFYSALWNSRNDAGQLVSSGIYFYKIQAGNFVAIKKMVLLR